MRMLALALLGLAPAQFYDFKPNPGEMSFGQQMTHVAGSMSYRFWQISGIEPPFKKEIEQSDKETALKALNLAYDYMLVHAAHHRAQCEVSMRINNIKPPEYRF